MDGLVRVSCPRCGVRRDDSQPRAARAEVCRSCGHTWSWSAEQVEDFWRARVGLHFRKRSEPYAGLVCRLVSIDPLTLFSVSGDLAARPSRERFDLDWQDVAGATDDDKRVGRHMTDITRALAREGLQLGVPAVPSPTPDDLRLLEMTAAGILPASTPELQRDLAAAQASIETSAKSALGMLPDRATSVAVIRAALLELPTDDDRLEVLRDFCRGCGRVEPEDRSCHCENDE